MAESANREFGRRKPVAIQAAAPVKRSNHVALLLMGTFAVGGVGYMLTPRDCEPNQPGIAGPSVLPTNAECRPRGSTSSGVRSSTGGSWSRSSFFSGDSSAGGSSLATSSGSGSEGVTRGGFGSFARAFTVHFSGGG